MGITPGSLLNLTAVTMSVIGLQYGQRTFAINLCIGSGVALHAL